MSSSELTDASTTQTETGTGTGTDDEKDHEHEDPTVGAGNVISDFSDLKKALAAVKQVLTPYDWIEFAKDYDTQKGMQAKHEREERERRIATGEESDDEPEDERPLAGCRDLVECRSPPEKRGRHRLDDAVADHPDGQEPTGTFERPAENLVEEDGEGDDEPDVT